MEHSVQTKWIQSLRINAIAHFREDLSYFKHSSRSLASAPPSPNELRTPALERLEILGVKLIAACWGQVDCRFNDRGEFVGCILPVFRVEVDALARVVVVDAHDIDINSGCGAQSDACQLSSVSRSFTEAIFPQCLTNDAALVRAHFAKKTTVT